MSSVKKNEDPQQVRAKDAKPNSEEEEKGGFRRNIVGLSVLTLLYIIQGMTLSFFKMSIPAIFAEKRASYSDLAILSTLSIPYSLKFIFAPILDSFYFRKFGQRKSYIVPLQYLFVAISLLLAYHLQDYVNGGDISSIFFFGLICILIASIQDIAVDGWMLTILTPDYIPFGSSAESLGLMVGGFIAYNVFIPLNSTYFCNKYLFSTPSNQPILSIGNFWMITAIFVFAVTFYVHFFVKEKRLKKEECASFRDVVESIKLFYKNPNLSKISLICLTQFIGSTPTAAFFDNLLIKNGFHKETFANMNTIIVPLEFFVSIAVAKFCKKNQELRISVFGSIFGLIRTCFQLFVLWYFFSGGNHYVVIVMAIICQIATGVHRQVSIIAISSFFNRISKRAVGSTFISTRAALGNLGGLWVRSGALFMGDYLPWYTVCGGAFGFGILYLFWYSKIMKELQTKKKEE